MYHIFIHSSVDGHLGCFHALAIVNSAAINTGVHVSFQTMVFSRYMPRSWIAGSYRSSSFSFLFCFVLFFKLINLFIYGCVGSSFLCEGFLLVVASGGHSSSRCAGLSLSRPLLLWSTGSRCAGSVIAAHGPSCSAACGIFPDQGSNPRSLHWQADSQPLLHQGSPSFSFLKEPPYCSP